MAVVLNATFATDVDGFSAGTQVSAEGADFETGYLSIPSNTTITRSWTAITSGIARVSFWVFDPSSETAADTSKDTYFYLFPSGLSGASGNSLATVWINRNSTYSATSTVFSLGIRNGATFSHQYFLNVPRSMWLKVSIVVNLAAKTWDLYLNDVLMSAGLAFPNASAASLDKVAILNQTAAPATYVDNVTVESDWTLPAESVLVSDDFTIGTAAIETTAPSDDRNIFPQPWKIPDNQTTYGAFDRSANGLVADSGKECCALARCGAEGIFESTWTASAAGRIYGGLIFRVWAGLGSDSYLMLRYDSGASSGERISLRRGSTALVNASATVTAGASYTLRVIARGRLAYCYLNGVLQFGGPVDIGNRGQLSEEHAGPYFTVGAADNYCTSFAWTGRVTDKRLDLTVGNNRWNLEPTSLRELYRTDSAKPARNLFWSKGSQHIHVSEADAGNYETAQQRIFNTSNVQSVRQRSICLRENRILGHGQCWVTLLRRGAWVDDGVVYFGGGSGINYTPDTDFRGDLAGSAFRHIGDTGSSTLRNFAPFATWAGVVAAAAGVKAFEYANADADAKLLVGLVPTVNSSSLSNNVLVKNEGNGDPISIAFNFQGGDLTQGTEYRTSKSIHVDGGTGLAVSDAAMQEFRDDLKTPAAFTYSAGSVKSNAAGDYNADGFNERYGWYEVNAASDAVSITNDAIKRIKPCFRIYGLSSDEVAVTIGGSPQTLGTHYWIDDLGDGSHLVQLNGDLAASQTFAVALESEPPVPPISGTLSIDGVGIADDGTMYAANIATDAVATAAVQPDGSYAFVGLVAGTYRVWGEVEHESVLLTTQVKIEVVT